MKITKEISDFLLKADSKALATLGIFGLNVVPVSSIFIVDDKIWLINYFFKKTLENILENQKIALVCWKEMLGYQIKGVLEYCVDGSDFEKAKKMVAEKLPDRIVKGLLIISPLEIYDISPKAS